MTDRQQMQKQIEKLIEQTDEIIGEPEAEAPAPTGQLRTARSDIQIRNKNGSIWKMTETEYRAIQPERTDMYVSVVNHTTEGGTTEMLNASCPNHQPSRLQYELTSVNGAAQEATRKVVVGRNEDELKTVKIDRSNADLASVASLINEVRDQLKIALVMGQPVAPEAEKDLSLGAKIQIIRTSQDFNPTEAGESLASQLCTMISQKDTEIRNTPIR